MVDVGQMPTSYFEFGKKTFKKVPINCRRGKRTIEFDFTIRYDCQKNILDSWPPCLTRLENDVQQII